MSGINIVSRSLPHNLNVWVLFKIKFDYILLTISQMWASQKIFLLLTLVCNGDDSFEKELLLVLVLEAM